VKALETAFADTPPRLLPAEESGDQHAQARRGPGALATVITLAALHFIVEV
jgi:hypothetical protein